MADSKAWMLVKCAMKSPEFPRDGKALLREEDE